MRILIIYPDQHPRPILQDDVFIDRISMWRYVHDLRYIRGKSYDVVFLKEGVNLTDIESHISSYTALKNTLLGQQGIICSLHKASTEDGAGVLEES